MSKPCPTYFPVRRNCDEEVIYDVSCHAASVSAAGRLRSANGRSGRLPRQHLLGWEIYICLDQLTDAPDEADAVGKVTSTVKLGDQPTKDGQSSVADKRSPIVPMEGGLAAKVDGAWYFFRLYDAEKDGPLC